MKMSDNKLLNFTLDKETHKKFKIIALMNDVRPTSILRDFVRKYIKENEEK